ncbi:hypothetical protein P7C73_g5241, partial [Tremellales sp. Uapishka_1]
MAYAGRNKDACNGCCDHRIAPTSLPLGQRVSTELFGQNARTSLSQPHFAEQTVTIRRISINPFEPDEIQRLNSVSSSLVPAPSSEDLRKNSRDSLSVHTVQALEGGVSIGERRPSVLCAGAGGVGPDSLPVRKISAGGGEETISIRRTTISTAPVAAPSSPALPSPHPFSAASLARTSSYPRRASFRQVTLNPDSMIFSRSSLVSPSRLSAVPGTAASLVAMKSPGEGRTPDTGLFDRWKGFEGEVKDERVGRRSIVPPETVVSYGAEPKEPERPVPEFDSTTRTSLTIDPSADLALASQTATELATPISSESQCPNEGGIGHQCTDKRRTSAKITYLADVVQAQRAIPADRAASLDNQRISSHPAGGKLVSLVSSGPPVIPVPHGLVGVELDGTEGGGMAL